MAAYIAKRISTENSKLPEGSKPTPEPTADSKVTPEPTVGSNGVYKRKG